MERIHFLNVKNGDCSWIQHASGRNTVIDICNGNMPKDENLKERRNALFTSALDAWMTPNFSGNFRCKDFPTNPINYFLKHDMQKEIFRFILTHPDMDHLDGLNELANKFMILNFWDTDNDKTMDKDSFGSQYYYDDWSTYQRLRKGECNSKVLQLYSGVEGREYTNDGLDILSPTPELIKDAKEHNDYNTSSYVILYTTTKGRKVLFCGDSDPKAWECIMELHSDKLANIDVLIASHHGRKSGGCSKYLDILNPKLTLFGYAKSEYLDYSSWSKRKSVHFTNNQVGNVILDFDNNGTIILYIENKSFATKYNKYSHYDRELEAWHLYTF